MVDLVP